jgi:hypothetical protein
MQALLLPVDRGFDGRGRLQEMDVPFEPSPAIDPSTYDVIVASSGLVECLIAWCVLMSYSVRTVCWPSGLRCDDA